jgi:hypothetical protein
MRINEVDPRNYDSDIDYYNALRAVPKRAQEPDDLPEPSRPYTDKDAEEDISQQRQRADAKFRQKRKVEYVDQEGSAPNGQKHNKLYVIDAQDEATARHEEYLFDKHEWGAKKVVDTKLEKNEDGSVKLTLYIVDNHKYGLWRPWKESPVYKESAETPESELERLKLRQNAEHGRASLQRQSETQARIRELEKQIKDKQGVAEGTGNVGAIIKTLCQKIYDAGDDEFEYFYNDSPIFAQYWDEYEGDLDSIIAEVDPKELQVIHDELESYVQQANLAEGYLDNPGQEDSPVAQAIIRRILMQRADLLQKYGPEKVGQAIDDVADFVGDVEEIGSSDVSGWIKHVEQMLGNMGESVAEGSNNLRSAVLSVIQGIYNGAQAGEDMIDNVSDELGDYFNDVKRSKDQTLRNAYQLMRQQGAEAEGDPLMMAQVAKQAIDMLSQPMAEAEANPKDVICVDVPLFIRLMEYAREDASTDMDLHDVAERLIRLSAEGKTVSMSSYDEIVGSQKEIKEEGMSELEQGRKNIISILKAGEQGQDAQITVGGEPITLEYPEARFVGGRYKAFLKAGRQEEFLRALTDARAFDRIMSKMRAVIDKQRNFRGSVPGERGVEESAANAFGKGDDLSNLFRKLQANGTEREVRRFINWALDSGATTVADAINLGAKTDWDNMGGNSYPGAYEGWERAIEVTGFQPKRNVEEAEVNPQSMALKENEYYCQLDKKVKLIPEGYKKNKDGFLVRK